ncbi:MAG: hypothetical protein NVS9B4_28140 [Candidatus Acidiferrum sp.]
MVKGWWCLDKIILLADDHEPVRSRLKTVLESVDEWKIAGEAENGAKAVALHEQIHPEVTVMDFHMPGLNGLEASRRILKRDPKANILMVTVDASRELAREAKKAGLKGICSKGQIECIVEAVKGLLQGREYFPDFVN